MKNLTSLLLVTAIIIIVNLLSSNYSLRWDVTKDKQYTLSEATKNIIGNLEDPVTVKAYFTEDLPQQLMKGRQDLQDMLIEFGARSGNMVNYEFINPDSPELEQEAIQNGISPILINVREKDEAVQKKAIMGAIISSGDKQEIIPLIQPGAALEYMLTTSIKKTSPIDKPTIGYITGHREPNLGDQLAMVNESLSVLYTMESVDLGFHEEINPNIKTMLWVNPQDSIPPTQFDKLDRYLEKGGNLCLAFNTVEGNFQTVQGIEVKNGIKEWLQTKGFTIQSDFVVDARCGNISVQQKQGYMTFNTAVNFHYFPMINSFEEHPITKGIDQVIFQFASALNYAGNATFTPIVKTSELSNVMPAPVFFNIEKKWSKQDFPMQHQTLGGVLEQADANGSKLVIFTDGDFPTGNQGQGQNADNVSLLVNSVDWLSDDTGLIDLRTKGVASRPIRDLEDGEKTRMKWMNFTLPILFVIGYGLFRTQRNRLRRRNRQLERYVSN